MRKYKMGDVVWVKGIVSHEVAGWVEVFFNRDTQSLYVESKNDIRLARKKRQHHQLCSAEKSGSCNCPAGKNPRPARKECECGHDYEHHRLTIVCDGDWPDGSVCGCKAWKPRGQGEG